ncbi:MAG: hypothetical protein M1820_007236 [Bogoriella megaspora]|nr:MAG: hypothetical protein M1820_007236 [Bogoriella megaspora]
MPSFFWEQKAVPGSTDNKEGWFARRSIPRGTCIHSEAPKLSRVDHPGADSSPDQRAHAPADSPANCQRSNFLPLLPVGTVMSDLSNNISSEGVRNRSAVSRQDIALDAPQINHSCRPNAVWSFDSSEGVLKLHACLDIAPGTQIFVNYLLDSTFAPRDTDIVSLTEGRRNKLQAKRGFLCKCEICDNLDDPAHGNRRNLHRLQVISKTPDPEFMRMIWYIYHYEGQEFPGASEAVWSYIRQMEHEKVFDTRLADGYVRLARVFQAMECRIFERECLKKALEILTCCMGATHPYVKWMARVSGVSHAEESAKILDQNPSQGRCTKKRKLDTSLNSEAKGQERWSGDAKEGFSVCHMG